MLFLGIENQSDLDYSMPIRTMIYDGVRYHKQFVSNRILKVKSSFKIKPVISLVVYLSPDKWNAPLCLYDMMDIPGSLKEFVNNYRINLISPYNMSEEDFSELTTQTKNLLRFLKFSKNADALSELINTEEYFRHMDKETLNMINTFTELDLNIDENEEVC